MQDDLQKKTLRRAALQGAKLAVRAYEREPSEKHARMVEKTWRLIQRIDAMDRCRVAERPGGERLPI